MYKGCSSSSYWPRLVFRVLVTLCELIFCDVGINVIEVAHDIQAQVSKYVRETLGLVNSYDTWHGTVLHVIHSVHWY